MNYINLNLLPIELDEDVIFPKEYYANTDIKDLRNFHIKGSIRYNLSDEVTIDIRVTGQMILIDAITLDEISYPIDLNIAETLDDLSDESVQYLEKSKNILDKLEFLWENIVLEVPISFTNSSGKNLKGEGWELNKESEEEEINPQLAKLKDLFKGGE